MARGAESSSLRLIEVVTLLSFLPEREEDYLSFPQGVRELTEVDF
jgi:hypothetical protein